MSLNVNFKQALSQLISTPSISSMDASWDQSNQQVITLLATWFEHLGFSIKIQQVAGSNNKYNLLAKLGSGEGGLLLGGHTDTVPFDQHSWQSDPFKLVEKDNHFYGLGTCDMKGFFAFILEACQAIPKGKLTAPLYVLATADEETTMAGARFFAQSQQIKPEVAIIGEPTELKPVIMHKGHMSHKITVKGKSGHSSQPQLGVNAIEIIYQVIGQLMALRGKLQQDYHNNAFSVAEPTLNLGAIKGGDNANRICGQCELHLDMRSLPGIKDEELHHWLLEHLKPVCEKYPGRIKIEELHPSSPSFAESENSELVKFAEQHSGHCCQAVNYATEAPFIQQLGCQTLVLGPGSIKQAHQPNEFLALTEVKPTLSFLTQAIERYCFS
jgi:acetylornithine deacetylase